MKFGYSTGSLACGDFNKGIALLKQSNATSIELSALREGELKELVSSINSLDLEGFSYISFHAPSRLKELTEKEVIILLQKVAEKRWPIVVHPDIIQEGKAWEEFGHLLCIENMDKRKPVGRTSLDLDRIFDSFPQATFCLDLAHSKQIDPTMLETKLMLKKFSNRLSQVHLSEVNSKSQHEVLNWEAILSYRKVSKLIPVNVPIILESPLPVTIENEFKMASHVFEEQNVAEVARELEVELFY